MKEKVKPIDRRNFIRNTLKAGTLLAAGAAPVLNGKKENDSKTGRKIKVLTTDGTIIEVDQSQADCKIEPCEPPVGEAARQGIPGRKFVMVIDLARCKNARACIRGCQKGHNLASHQEWLKVYLMKDHENAEPYWFPQPCFHCDDPPCVKVCPVGATYKRQDNIVLIENNRCIGCKFCIAACPYSIRIFNWEKPPESDIPDEEYSAETSIPAQIGTVSKCDFCPDLSREGKLPYCVTSCPMGALYFGDMNEDAVCNGTETLRFRQLIRDRAGYRYLEELGTEPNVYYLPPVDRMFDYRSGMDDLSEKQKKMYENVISSTQSDE